MTATLAGPIQGQFWPDPGNNGTFSSPTGTPAYTATFPTIDFNPAADLGPFYAIPSCSTSVTSTTTPLTDVIPTTSGPCGEIPLPSTLTTGLQAAFSGQLTVPSAGTETFSVVNDAGFLFGIDGGATCSGDTSGPNNGGSTVPNSLTPCAYDNYVGITPSKITVTFPAAGTYTFDIDYISQDPGPNSNNTLTFGTKYTAPLVYTSSSPTPGAPAIVSAVGGDGTATLTWTAPSDTGSSPITSYTVTCTDPSSVTYTATTLDGNTLTATVTGLTNGTTYSCTVAASNANGAGADSAAVSVTPSTVPGDVQNLAATAGDSSATLTWNPPADDGGAAIDSYDITASIVGMAKAKAHKVTKHAITKRDVPCDMGTPSTCTMTVAGLTNGQTYSITVQAHNVNGDGPPAGQVPSSVIVTPASVPGQVQNLAVHAGVSSGTGSANATWGVPTTDGGSPITGYDVQVFAANGTTPAREAQIGQSYCCDPLGACSVSVTGLTLGSSYVLSVQAHNAAGDGEAATQSFTVSPITITAPDNVAIQYSDKIGLRVVATEPTKYLTLTASGLPSGYSLSIARRNGQTTGTVMGKDLAPAGTYPVTFTASDGKNTTTQVVTIVVTPESAMVMPRITTPLIATAPRATTASMTLAATVQQVPDGSAGDIRNAGPITYTLTPASGLTPSAARTTKAIVQGPLTCTATSRVVGQGLQTSCAFTSIPVGVYDVTIAIGSNNQYYQGQIDTAITVYQPGSGAVVGAAGIKNGQVHGDVAFLGIPGAAGAQPQGEFLYIDHEGTGDVIVAAPSLGALTVDAATKTATFDATPVINGSYGGDATLTVTNGGTASTNTIGLQTTDSSSNTIPSLTFAPTRLLTGRVIVPTS
ncbi:MAG: fibronectin type III domain-containing protein [Actinobacteria bacterium]|nr:fibronectin type III domain-containing protein [Actinomycetota bacterium]